MGTMTHEPEELGSGGAAPGGHPAWNLCFAVMYTEAAMALAGELGRADRDTPDGCAERALRDHPRPQHAVFVSALGGELDAKSVPPLSTSIALPAAASAGWPRCLRSAARRRQAAKSWRRRGAAPFRPQRDSGRRVGRPSGCAVEIRPSESERNKRVRPCRRPPWAVRSERFGVECREARFARGQSVENRGRSGRQCDPLSREGDRTRIAMAGRLTRPSVSQDSSGYLFANRRDRRIGVTSFRYAARLCLLGRPRSRRCHARSAAGRGAP